LIKALSLLGCIQSIYLALNTFDTYSELVIDLRIYEPLKYLKQ